MYSLLQCLLFMNFGGVITVDYTINNCCAIKSDGMIRSCNRVCNSGPITRSDVININSFFGNMPYTWVVDIADQVTIEILKQQGLEHKISCYAMMQDLKRIEPCAYTSGITIQEIIQSEMPLWITIVAKSFDYSENEFSKTIVSLQKRAGDAIKFYIGFWHQKAVAASMIIQHKDTISIHKVGVLPEYRGNGIGYAITHASLCEAQKHGYTRAVLLASPMGKSLYEKMGFEEYAIYALYGN